MRGLYTPSHLALLVEARPTRVRARRVSTARVSGMLRGANFLPWVKSVWDFCQAVKSIPLCAAPSGTRGGRDGGGV